METEGSVLELMSSALSGWGILNAGVVVKVLYVVKWVMGFRELLRSEIEGEKTGAERGESIDRVMETKRKGYDEDAKQKQLHHDS